MKLVPFLMIPMAYKRIWITYPVHFINGHHQLTPVSCILYTRLNRSVQLQKHLAVSTPFSVLMPRFLRRSSAQALLPVQILPTLYTNFSMKTVLHQPPRVAFPSSAPESLAGVFPCVLNSSYKDPSQIRLVHTPLFYLNHPFKGPDSKYIHILRY